MRVKAVDIVGSMGSRGRRIGFLFGNFEGRVDFDYCSFVFGFCVSCSG